MATHPSIHAWKIPWTEEPGGLQSMGSQGVRHDRHPPTLYSGSFTFGPPQNVQACPTPVSSPHSALPLSIPNFLHLRCQQLLMTLHEG